MEWVNKKREKITNLIFNFTIFFCNIKIVPCLIEDFDPILKVFFPRKKKEFKHFNKIKKKLLLKI